MRGEREPPRRCLHIYIVHSSGLRTTAGADVLRSQVHFQI